MSETPTPQYTHEQAAQTPQREQTPLAVSAKEGSQKPQPEARLIPKSEVTEQWMKMSTADILNGIEDGKITDTNVLPLLAKKGLIEQQLLIHSFTQQQPDRKEIHEKNLAELEARYKPLVEGEKKALIENCLQRAERNMTFDYPYETDNTNYTAAAKWYEMAARLATEKAKEPATTRPEQPNTVTKNDQEPMPPTIEQTENLTTEQHKTLEDTNQQSPHGTEKQNDISKKGEKSTNPLNQEAINYLMQHPFSGLRAVLRSSFSELTGEQFETITESLEFGLFEIMEHFAEIGPVLKDGFSSPNSSGPSNTDIFFHNQVERGKKVVMGIMNRRKIKGNQPLVQKQQSDETNVNHIPEEGKTKAPLLPENTTSTPQQQTQH